jgi:hypothetical protein
MQNVVVPAFTNLAIQSSQKVAADVHREASAAIEGIHKQRQADAIKIDQLTQLVTGLTQTVSSMASAQTEFQAQFLKMQQQAAIDRREAAARQAEGHNTHPSESRASTSLTGPVEEKSTLDVEYETMMESILQTMNDGDYENAIIKWLQTRREQEFFRNYFSKFNPNFVQGLTPLLLLSLGATISMEFEDELLQQRVLWMEAIVASFQLHINAGPLVSFLLNTFSETN